MKLILSILMLVLLFSCRTTDLLIGKSYVYKSKQRTLELQFDNDSICRLINTFHCDDIDSEIKTITQKCIYSRIGNKQIIINANPNNQYEDGRLFLDIPVQNSKMCDFLNLEQRTKYKTIGPAVATNYARYGLVPRIAVDTLYIHRNRIVFYKQDEFRSIGFIFK